MPHHRRAQGQAPCLAPATAEAGGLYEDTSRTRPEHLLPRPVRLGHITTLSSPFNQRLAAVTHGGVKQASPNVAYALVFGASPKGARLRREAYPPRSHDKLSLHPSINIAAPGIRPGTVSFKTLLQTPPDAHRWWR